MKKPEPSPVFGKIKAGITYVDRPGAYAFLFNAEGEMAVIETSYGFFLPGGGVDPGEDTETALRRELLEEIGYSILHLRYLGTASQFHWSEFYQQHFKKIGSFYQVEASPAIPGHVQDEHALLWWPRERAASKLTQEFQRWAVPLSK